MFLVPASYPFDSCPQRPQFLVEAFVAAVYMVHVRYLRAAADGGQAGDDQRGARQHVERLNARAVERGRPANDSSGRAGRHYVGAHLAQLAGVEEAVVEHALVKIADAVGPREEDGHQRLAASREAGIGAGLYGEGAQRRRAAGPYRLALDLDLAAGRGGGGNEVMGAEDARVSGEDGGAFEGVARVGDEALAVA